MGLIIVKKAGGDYIIRVAGGAILHRRKSARKAMIDAFNQWKGTGWKVIYLTITGDQINIDDDYFNKYLRPDKLANSGTVRRSDGDPDHHHHYSNKGNHKRAKK